MFYAITLTASPHKKHISPFNSILKSAFKAFSEESQRKIFKRWLDKFVQNFHDFRYVFETCPTSGVTHVHMCVQPITDHSHMYPEEIVKDFLQAFHFEFGYHGKNNKPEHYYDSQEILTMKNYEHWQDYMYKTISDNKLF